MIGFDPCGHMPPLETERLLLRRLNMHDAKDIFEYSRDPEVARHVLWEPQRSIGDARAYLRYMIRRYRQNEPASWGIELKSTGKIIGTIGFMWIQSDNAAAEVGYSLARSQWNRGIMTEALRAVLGYGLFHAAPEPHRGHVRGGQSRLRRGHAQMRHAPRGHAAGKADEQGAICGRGAVRRAAAGLYPTGNSINRNEDASQFSGASSLIIRRSLLRTARCLPARKSR